MTPEAINHFWLVEVGEQGWYERSDALDQTIRDRFMSAWESAQSLTATWQDTPQGVLAALILTDQFPRNMFREDARAFSTDALALRIAADAVANGTHLQIPVPQRQFVYLPFEHSEDPADQDRAVALFAQFMPGENLHHAELHRDAIRKFGRFPWRNAALGRANTPAEQAILNAGGYAALVQGSVSLDAL